VTLLLKNDLEVGIMVLALVALAAILYIGSSIHPLHAPDSPFRTPVSGFISWFSSRSRISPEPAVPSQPCAQKAQALNWLLAESVDTKVINECIRAMAGLPAVPSVQDELSKPTSVTALCGSLRGSMGGNSYAEDEPTNVTTFHGKLKPSTDRNNHYAAPLYALFRLVQTVPVCSDLQVASDLMCLVAKGGPLFDLQIIDISILGIATCVKARILLLIHVADGHAAIFGGEQLFDIDLPILIKSSTSNSHMHRLLMETQLFRSDKANPSLQKLRSHDYGERCSGHRELVEKAKCSEYSPVLIGCFTHGRIVTQVVINMTLSTLAPLMAGLRDGAEDKRYEFGNVLADLSNYGG
jgi:hypothetical protein